MKIEEEKAAWKQKDTTTQKSIVTSIYEKHFLRIRNSRYAHQTYEKPKHMFEKLRQDQMCILLQHFYSLNNDKDLTPHNFLNCKLGTMQKILNQQIDENIVISNPI